MTSIYETIMELPLMKGISREQLSQMLEKTSVSFLYFKSGDKLYGKDDPVRSIDFLLKGRVKRRNHIEPYGICITELLGEGMVMGANRLYGIHTTYGCDIEAFDDVSVMRISKEQYLNILRSDEIFLMNYLNYLSAAAQRPLSFLREEHRDHVSTMLGMLLKSVVWPMAERITIEASDEAISQFLGIKEELWEEWKRAREAEGNIEVTENGVTVKK